MTMPKSSTPRTDKECFFQDWDGRRMAALGPCVDADFARTLETELLAMKRLALKYGWHKDNCDILMFGYQSRDRYCTCGWTQEWAKLKAELEEK